MCVGGGGGGGREVMGCCYLPQQSGVSTPRGDVCLRVCRGEGGGEARGCCHLPQQSRVSTLRGDVCMRVCVGGWWGGVGGRGRGEPVLLPASAVKGQHP